VASSDGSDLLNFTEISLSNETSRTKSSRPPTMADTNELNTTNEVNDDNEVNDTTKPNEPREASEPTEPGKIGLRDVCSYAVVINTRLSNENGSVQIEGVYTDFRDAVTNLKSARLEMQHGWIAPTDRDTREAYPYRNKIGAIWSDDGQFLGWGYAWFDPRGGDSVHRVWIARIRVWCRVGEETTPVFDSDDERDLLDDTSDIEFVAFGQQLPGGARFDEDTKDLIFPGEEEQESEEDELAEDDQAEDGLEGDGSEEDALDEGELDEDELDEDAPVWREQTGFHDPDKEEEVFGIEDYDHEYPDWEGEEPDYGEDDVQEDRDEEYELRKLHKKGL